MDYSALLDDARLQKGAVPARPEHCIAKHRERGIGFQDCGRSLLSDAWHELRRLTFELSGRRRQDARPGLAKMYRVPPDRAWWPAVGAPLERGVRPHSHATQRPCASSTSLGALRPHVFANLLRSTGKCQPRSVTGVWLRALWWASSAVRALEASVEVTEATKKHDGTLLDLPSSTLEPHLEG